MLPGVFIHTRAPGGQNGLQVRPRRSDHEIPGESGQRFQHLPGVLLAGGLAGDDDRASLHLSLVVSGSPVLRLYDVPHPLGVDGALIQQGGKVDLAAVDHFLVCDLNAGDGEGVGPIEQGQPGQH